ncbi:uncharacterized protein LOC112183970 [Rosa chinensis]|uniref:uncharacterized protein LOC112183970 n=1 Tax=Rosa chinensis TaxID=74649 RepID=UPI000D096459|nr:uncharacterized protein LOC112183970 [Rosa chinensis]
MADPLVTRCLYSGKGYMIPLNQCMSYSELYEDIFRTFQFLPSNVIELQYSVPGCEVCFLRNDSDFHMLFCSARIHRLECVDISVLKIGGSCRRTCSVDSCSEVIDEDDYLGDAFRTEVHKTYLSDEWSSYIHHVGDKFHGVSELREKLRKYAVAVGFEFVFLRNDLDHIHAVCANVGTEGCDWHLRALSSSTNGCLYITELNNIHTCKGVVKTQKHKLLGSKVVKTCIAADVSYSLSLKPREIMSKFKSTYGFDISYKVALKAKHKAKEAIYGSDADSFRKLSWYKEAVLQSNPSSSFVLEVDPSTNHFQRLFVSYGGCVEGFQFCLPVLYVDGTFGKNIYKGQILSATGRNGNQAYGGCVEGFQFCLPVLYVDGTFGKSIYKGQILSATGRNGNQGFYPLAICRHLVVNLVGKYKGKGNSVLIEDVKQKFFKVAYSSIEKEYHFNLRLLRAVGDADIIDHFLAEILVENWCCAFYTSCRYGIMANGIAESFNSWIAIERLMPVYCMLDQTRIKQMEQMGERRDEAQCWTTELTPKIEERLKVQMEKSRRFSVHCSSPRVYEVRSDFSYVVNISDHSCSCVKWQINCFPCPYGLAAIQAASENVYDYIDKYFCVDMFKKSYSFPIRPITNVDMSSSESATECILPPLAKRPPRRPRVKRFKLVGEVEKKLIRCGRCGKMGTHNKLSCTEPLVQQ